MAVESRTGLTRVEVLVLVVSIGVLAALLFPAIQASRTADRRLRRKNNLRALGMSLQNFHDTYKRFPATVRRDDVGRPLSSWRYQILPFVAGFMIEVDYSRPWLEPEAKYFVTKPLTYYCFPQSGRNIDKLNTNVVSIVGPRTIFDDNGDGQAPVYDDRTILAIEIAEFDRHWMEPGDLHIADLAASHLSGIDGQGMLVLFVGGGVSNVNKNTPVDELRKYMTIDRVAGRSDDVFEK